MKKRLSKLTFLLIAILITGVSSVWAGEKQTITAIYIPLADHYPGLVAYEKYRGKMEKADYRIERMKSWPLLRAYFMSGEHNQEAIIQSLRPDLNVINYSNLNVDKAGLKQIMDYALEGGILKKPIDIDAFADGSFATEITEK